MTVFFSITTLYLFSYQALQGCNLNLSRVNAIIMAAACGLFLWKEIINILLLQKKRPLEIAALKIVFRGQFKNQITCAK